MMEVNIPQQYEGGFSDTVSDISFDTPQEAASFFETVKHRFLDVNSWALFAGEEKADFALISAAGTQKFTAPQPGDYFRINIPGPKNPTGGAYDWVRVEHYENPKAPSEEMVLLRVRPCPDPFDNGEATAHFYASDATSTFLVKREGAKITAEVHGRNEKPNTEDLGLLEKIRNTLVAVGGILAGSKFQWKSLTEGLVKYEK